MMHGQPIQEGPPNRTQMIANALAEIGEQYDGIHDVLNKVGAVLTEMDKRLAAIERKLK